MANLAAQACNLIIFGAKSDLAQRKLLPSLYHLEKKGLIHPDTKIIGVGRADWNTNIYIKIVRKSLEKFLNECITEKIWYILSKRLNFYNLDVNEIKNFKKLGDILEKKTRITISYLAMPPITFFAICQGLGEAGLNNELNRIIIEKPIGTNLKSFHLINNQVTKYFHENQIYRIDHYLGKETIMNLLVLRFANSFFTYNWDYRFIDHVQITISEEVGIEGRWKYFDKVGQMRDMIQSHLLQILTIIAMSPPLKLTADHIRDEKVKVLRSLRMINYSNIKDVIVRGQYTNGFIKGKRVLGYLEEEGINKNSRTETFVAIRVNIDNWRWAGVPFYLRTGKRLPTKCSKIVIYFKKPILNLFDNAYQELPQNKLTIRLQPNEGIDIHILNKTPGLNPKNNLQIAQLNMNFIDILNQENLVDAYEHLLMEAMRGIQTLFVRCDEIEYAWQWVDSITESWENNKDTPKPYQAGTWGPIDSINMMIKDGRYWD